MTRAAPEGRRNPNEQERIDAGLDTAALIEALERRDTEAVDYILDHGDAKFMASLLGSFVAMAPPTVIRGCVNWLRNLPAEWLKAENHGQ
jgi:hypothetical protein